VLIHILCALEKRSPYDIFFCIGGSDAPGCLFLEQDAAPLVNVYLRTLISQLRTTEGNEYSSCKALN
jgi:hypothetical protein